MERTLQKPGYKVKFLFGISQTDGQSEIASLTIIDLLKAYVTEVDHRDQWEKYLPMVEYAYNNTIHTSTGKTPFEIVEGRPKLPLMVKYLGRVFAVSIAKTLLNLFKRLRILSQERNTRKSLQLISIGKLW